MGQGRDLGGRDEGAPRFLPIPLPGCPAFCRTGTDLLTWAPQHVTFSCLQNARREKGFQDRGTFLPPCHGTHLGSLQFLLPLSYFSCVNHHLSDTSRGLQGKPPSKETAVKGTRIRKKMRANGLRPSSLTSSLFL